MTVSLLLWFWAAPSGRCAEANPDSLEVVQQLTESLPADPSQVLDSFWTGSGGAGDGAAMRRPVPLSAVQTNTLPLTATVERTTRDVGSGLQELRGAVAEDFRQLLSMSSEELDLLFENSPAGPIPDGDSEGMALPFSGTLLGRFLSWLFSLFWQGKVFDASEGTVVNKILGLRMIRAKASIGPSWHDSKESVIVDYWGTSWVASMIRDELRQVAPGVYLGRGYLRTPFGTLHIINFALRFNQDSQSPANISLFPD